MAETGAHPVTARVEACFSSAQGVTLLGSSYCSAPLKIGKTFPSDSGQLHVCLMDCSPGLLAGDSYAMAWTLGRDAHVLLTNQSFCKVHPSCDNPAYLRQRIILAKGARLEYLPEPVMLYQDAALRSGCEVTLEAGSTLLLSDILCAGRALRGEVFAFHSYQSRLHVRYADELIYSQQTRLCPQQWHPGTVGAWEDYTHWGNFYIFSDRIVAPYGAALVERLRQVMQAFPRLLSGVSLSYRYGIVVSMLGRRAWDMQQAAQQLRKELTIVE